MTDRDLPPAAVPDAGDPQESAAAAGTTYAKVIDRGAALKRISQTDVQHALGAEEIATNTPKVVYPGGITDREHAILAAHRWQLAHAAENTPTPSEAYTVIADLLRLLPFAELSAAIAKADGR